MLTVTPKAIASIKNAPIRYIIPRLLAYCGPTDELYKKQINRFRKLYQYYLNISVTKKKKKKELSKTNLHFPTMRTSCKSICQSVKLIKKNYTDFK